MTIKSLLIGSAAAIVATSGAQAADAVMASDPEPVEYVQVCDAFGAGYFYIPGTETCLKLAGYVRAESTITNVSHPIGVPTGDSATTSTLGHDVRITVDAKSDSEMGTIASHVRLDEQSGPTDILHVDRAHISIGDGNVLNVGLNGSIYDFSPVGEQSFNAGGKTDNQVSYSMSMDSVSIDVQATSLEDNSPVSGVVVGKVGFTMADLGVNLALGYEGSPDFTLPMGSRSRMAARVNVSFMDFGLRYDWSEKGYAGAFGNGYTHVFGASYGFDASDSLNLSFAADFADSFGNTKKQDAFAVSANAVYTIVENLALEGRVIYTDFSSELTTANTSKVDNTAVRLRLTRSF